MTPCSFQSGSPRLGRLAMHVAQRCGGFGGGEQRRARAACSASLRRSARGAGRLHCAARSSGPSQNSLRSLRSLRSNMLRQVSSRSALRARPGSPALLVAAEALRTPPERVFAGTAGSWGREGESQASSLRFAARATARASRRDAGSMPAARRSPTQRTGVSRKAVGGRRAQRLCGDEKRRAGVGARSALRELTRRSLFERSERSERSEFCGATPARASQCSRRAAPTAAAKRSTPPAHGFACAERAAPKSGKQASPNPRSITLRA